MRRLYSGAFAVIGWFALILQFILLLNNDASGIATGTRIVNFFSYFTILSNILATLMLTTAWAGRGGPFARPWLQTAVTIYMTITGLVYTSSSPASGNRPAGTSWRTPSSTTSCR